MASEYKEDTYNSAHNIFNNVDILKQISLYFDDDDMLNYLLIIGSSKCIRDKTISFNLVVDEKCILQHYFNNFKIFILQ